MRSSIEVQAGTEKITHEACGFSKIEGVQKQLKIAEVQTVLSLARHSIAGGILLGGHEEEEELLLEVEQDDELTR